MLTKGILSVMFTFRDLIHTQYNVPMDVKNVDCCHIIKTVSVFIMNIWNGLKFKRKTKREECKTYIGKMGLTLRFASRSCLEIKM